MIDQSCYQGRRAVCGSGTQRGFTLVELLVVITIISVLIAVLLPALAKARQQVRRVQCATNVKGLVLASLSYANDHENAPPFGGAGDGSYSMFDPDSRKILYEQYGLSSWKRWTCPGDAYRADTNVIRESKKTPRWFTDPTFSPSGVSWHSNNRAVTAYSYFGGPGRGFITDAIYQMKRFTKFDQIANPSSRTVWADVLKTPGVPTGGLPTWKVPANTHDNGGNAIPQGSFNGMADGHVDWRVYEYGINTHVLGNQYFIYRKGM